MAYTIISQNNTTTTLSDENGNVITVPARVTLATSTDYAITKVNNNSVDLESGDGKTIRGVPACVVLAGGGGGSDPHNLGFYADLTALQTAHPTGSDGDFAILGSTDTVWVWDSGTSAWKDTDTKGQVTSVNGQTGAVVIPDELPSQTGNSGKFLTTDGTDASWAAVGALPDQTGQSGKFLTTDGTDASWSDKPLVNTATSSDSLSILGAATTQSSSVLIGKGAGKSNSCASSVIIGSYAANAGYSTGSIYIGAYSGTTNNNQTVSGSVAIGTYAHTTVGNAIQISARITDATNSDSNTFKVANANGNYEIMSADGTIPTARLTKVNTTVTLASANWSGNAQTVSVTGITATGVVLVSPDPTDQSAYTSAGILATAQAAGTLTFSCDTVPSGDIDVNVVML